LNDISMKKKPTSAISDPNIFRPLARREGLIIEELDHECLVYDTAIDKAHCLNSSAATIWKHCDGARSLSDLETLLDGQVRGKDAPTVIAHCLAQLERAHLLTNSSPAIAKMTSRRELIRKLGIGIAAAAIVVPVITSITTPTPAAAASCIPNGNPCSADSQCCSNSCQPTGTSFVCRGPH
jgi:hypothetical protein